jgi:hypothetical protein
MPALPWVERQPIDPNASYFAMASRLPLRAYRFVPGFLRRTIAIRRQLALAPGLVGYGLDAQLIKRTFWTFSVWADRASLDAFAGSDPHRRMARELRSRMGESSFDFFQVEGGELPLSRRQIAARVG